MDPSSAQSSPTIRSPITLGTPTPSLLAIQRVSDFWINLEGEMEGSDSSDSSKTVPAEGAGADVDEASFFDLQPPTSNASHVKIEDVMARLVSAEHLSFILGDQFLFQRFSTFLNRFHPNMVPTLIRYLEMRKAIKAIEFANAVARKIRWPSHTDYCKFSRVQWVFSEFLFPPSGDFRGIETLFPPQTTPYLQIFLQHTFRNGNTDSEIFRRAGMVDVRFEDYAARELLLLCSEALPAFITHALIDVVTDCVAKDITGQAIPAVRDLVGNLAEVFCLTDPSIHDNPIIYASEEFHRTTQYGTTYAIDRNCRFLQGPASDKNTLLRISRAISLGRECNEVLLNYRRDGTPFINLLMCAPLYDDRGTIRYFIGAQIDVTGLIEHGMGIESFRALLRKDQEKQDPEGSDPRAQTPRHEDTRHSKNVKETLDRLQELSMMFSQDESDVVKNHSRCDDSTDTGSIRSVVPTSVKNRGQARRVIGAEELPGDGLNLSQLTFNNNSNHSLPGVYQHYMLVRPDPSLQIIFVSPSLRLPGLLRTHLFSKLGGPAQTISALQAAFRDGASVTAKVLWLPKSEARGRGAAEVKPRWIRCTPLLGSDDRVGVWMIILVPLENQVKPFGRGEHISHMVDEVEGERKRLDTISISGSREPSMRQYRVPGSRSGSKAPSMRKVVGEPPDIGLPKTPGKPKNGRADDGTQLYAEYLRSSSPAGVVSLGD